MIVLIIQVFLAFLLTFSSNTILELDYSNPIELLLLIVILIINLVISLILITIICSVYFLVIGKRVKKTNKFTHLLANCLASYCTILLRMNIEYSGKENLPKNNNFVLVGNHQENWDIFATKLLLKDFPIGFVAKQSLHNIPILGKAMLTIGCVPISKNADRSAAKTIITSIKQVKDGQPMSIFPEGKRTFSNTLIDFKPGALKLAYKPKADILVIALRDFNNTLKGFPFKSSKMKIKAIKVIPYAEYKDKSTVELAVELKDLIQSEVDKLA